jgi:hypothetical protein
MGSDACQFCPERVGHPVDPSRGSRHSAPSVGLLAALIGPVSAAAPKASLGTQSTAKITQIGTAHVGRSTGGTTLTVDQTQPNPDAARAGITKQIPNAINAARVPSAHVPRPAALPVDTATSGQGFDGLNHFNQRTAGTGAFTNTQFSLEPPDQALCVGAGFVVESVNTALRVRDATGGTLSPVVPLNAFFGLSPEFHRPAGPFGQFTSDPKCHFDPDTGRFFLSLLEIDVNAVTGDFGTKSATLLAVSKTSDPTGDWFLYSIDATDDGTNGTPSDPGCPCLGDQPLIGADATGFYISTNEFSILGPQFNGTQLYAMSKASLEAGTLPTVVHIGNLTQAEGPAFSMQPTTTPAGGPHATVNGGTEYLLSSLDFDATLDNRISLWALRNTSSLTAATPSVALAQTIVGTEVYGQPPAMEQRKGSAPLDEVLHGSLGAKLGLVAKPATEHLNVLNSNDDRMNQTVFAAGNVWGAVNTVVKGPNGVARTGIAWFIVTPSDSPNGALGGSIANQGYVSASNNNVVFPAIAANAAGMGLVSFTLVGQDFFPGVGYVRVNSAGAQPSINVARFGTGPADGFTGERSQDPVDNGVERWGDYGAAVAAADGSIWFANESINQTCTVDQFLADTSCGGTRTILANWGSFIGHVTP